MGRISSTPSYHREKKNISTSCLLSARKIVLYCMPENKELIKKKKIRYQRN